MAALPPRRLMRVMASREMTMSIECQAPRSTHWMRKPGEEMRPLAPFQNGHRRSSYGIVPEMRRSGRKSFWRAHLRRLELRTALGRSPDAPSECPKYSIG